jgi:rubrerythrin
MTIEPTAEVINAIETAIQIEKDGRAFYLEAADQTEDLKGRQMFQTLARDEKAHLELFERARDVLFRRGGWLSLEEVEAISPRRVARPPIFPTGEEIQATPIPAHRLAALKRAIQAEDDAIAFYAEQMRQTDDPNGRAMYAYLIEQEGAHRVILQGEYDYLAKTGYWFDIQEFDLEGAS